jgi:hypothetical protein
MRVCVWCRIWLNWNQHVYCSGRCRALHKEYGDPA